MLGFTISAIGKQVELEYSLILKALPQRTSSEVEACYPLIFLHMTSELWYLMTPGQPLCQQVAQVTGKQKRELCQVLRQMTDIMLSNDLVLCKKQTI